MRVYDLESSIRNADLKSFQKYYNGEIHQEFTNDNQIIIDVGINWDPEKGSIAGDVDFETVENKVFAISPVPRGVGAVTSSVLMKHVVEACILQTEAGHE